MVNVEKGRNVDALIFLEWSPRENNEETLAGANK